MPCSNDLYIPRRRVIHSADGKISQGRNAPPQAVYPLLIFSAVLFLRRAAGIYSFEPPRPMNGAAGVGLIFSGAYLAQLV